MKTFRRIGIIVLILAVVLVAGPWVIPALTQWSAINCRQAEINIRTGQARHTRRLWCVKVSERVEDTVLSEVLAGETVEAADVEPWHTAYRSWPGQGVFRHYAYHGALSQARELEVAFELFKPDEEQKQQIVRVVLTLWQTHGDYFKAGHKSSSPRYPVPSHRGLPNDRRRNLLKSRDRRDILRLDCTRYSRHLKRPAAPEFKGDRLS